MMLIPHRVGLQQRVLPGYRATFFDALADECGGGLGVFYGQPRSEEMIEAGRGLQTARGWQTRNLHLLGGRFYACWQTGWRSWLENWQPEVLILEANPRYLHIPHLLSWMHNRNRPVIGWGLGAPAAGGWRASLRRQFLSRFDALITYSRQGAGEYRQAGFAAERIFTAPNAVKPRPTWQLPERPADYPDGQPVILFVGRLQARKRIDLLLHACAALGEQKPELWLVGDGPARPELEKLAEKIYPQTRFPGAVHGPDLVPWFSRADLFVLPGTGGLAVQEAMSYGLPVLVAEADGTQTDLVRPENGWVLPPGDLDALTTRLGEALADPARLRRMGRASFEIVQNEINLENMVSVFAQAVKCVMEGETHAHPARR